MTNDTKSHRTRNALLVAGAFLLVLCGIGGGTAYYLYDRATEIDRSTPQLVTRQFLDAALTQKDVNQVSLYVCSSWSAEEAMEKVGPVADGVVVTWGDSVATVAGDTATTVVNVVYRASVGGVVQRLNQTWTLFLLDEDGWCVRDLTKAPSLNP